MRTVAIGVLLAGLVGIVSAQQRTVPAANGSPFGRMLFPGGQAPSGGSGVSPYGRILFPGTGAPAVARNTRGVPLPGNPAPPAPHPGHGQAVVPYPVFFGGNYLQYDPPQAQLANSYSAVPGQPDASPVVIVNQYFRPDALPEPQPVAQAPAVAAPAAQVTAENQDKDTYFLIAMKDHTIYAASAYWVEDNTLNYITIQGSQNSASLDAVDRALSRRLNRDRNVSFGLPGN